jgi:hypothetical protein
MNGKNTRLYLENKLLGLRWRLRQAWWDGSSALSWQLGGRARYERNWRQQAGNHAWAFIVGCNNSGTSLLSDIFRRSGLVSTMPGEGQYLTQAMLRLPLPGHERVWSEVLDEIQADLERLPARMPRLVHDWMRSHSRPLQRILLEKTPANLARMRALEAHLDCRFIGMVRNGYVVAEGIRRKAGKSLERGARHWDAVARLMLRERPLVRHFHLVSYEDLTTRPDKTLAGVARFLELPPEPLVQAGQARFRVGRTVAGASASGIRNFNAPSLARLSAEDCAVIRALAGETLARFGYADQEPASGKTP